MNSSLTFLLKERQWTISGQALEWHLRFYLIKKNNRFLYRATWSPCSRHRVTRLLKNQKTFESTNMIGSPCSRSHVTRLGWGSSSYLRTWRGTWLSLGHFLATQSHRCYLQLSQKSIYFNGSKGAANTVEDLKCYILFFWDRFGSIGCCNWSEWTRPKALTSPTLTSCSIRWFVDKMSIHDMFLPVGYFHWGKRPPKKLLGNFFYFHLRIWKSLPTAKFHQRISPRLVGQKFFILQWK